MIRTGPDGSVGHHLRRRQPALDRTQQRAGHRALRLRSHHPARELRDCAPHRDALRGVRAAHPAVARRHEGPNAGRDSRCARHGVPRPRRRAGGVRPGTGATRWPALSSPLACSPPRAPGSRPLSRQHRRPRADRGRGSSRARREGGDRDGDPRGRGEDARHAPMPRRASPARAGSRRDDHRGRGPGRSSAPRWTRSRRVPCPSRSSSSSARTPSRRSPPRRSGKIAGEVAGRPAAEIVVIGHTDRVGSDQQNDVLSLQRAERVRQELVRLGIDPERIVDGGRGASANPSSPRTTRSPSRAIGGWRSPCADARGAARRHSTAPRAPSGRRTASAPAAKRATSWPMASPTSRTLPTPGSAASTASSRARP